MKHTLLLLLAATLSFATYGQGTQRSSIPQSNLPQYATAYYTTQVAANAQIQNWHKLVKIDQKLAGSVNMTRTAFLVPRVTLDSLINSQKLNSDYVVFYIGIDNQDNEGYKASQRISLFYNGAKYDASGKLNAIPLTNVDPAIGGNPVPQVFDQSFPCPRCDGTDMHNQDPSVALPVANYFSQVLNTPDGDGKPHGTILPLGQWNVFKIDSIMKYIITPDAGYKIGSINVDGAAQEIVNPVGMTYPFPPRTTSSHNITVQFVQVSPTNNNVIKPKKK